MTLRSGQAEVFELMIKNIEDVIQKRMDAGLPVSHKIPEMVAVCQEALRQFDPQAPEKSHRFIMDLQRRLQFYVRLNQEGQRD